MKRRPSRVPVAVVAAVALVAALLIGAWSTGRLNSVICGGYCEASNATAPEGLRSSISGDKNAADQVSTTPNLEAVLTAASEPMENPLLGDHVGIAVAGVDADGPVAAIGSGTFTPASTTKILTGYAALAALDPKSRFATTVVANGDQLVLVGGGDPYLTDDREKGDPAVWRADLATLAERTAEALKKSGQTEVSLAYDDSLFTGPNLSPAWKDSYVPNNVVTPISPLWVDRGMLDTDNPEFTARVPDPPKDAAETFATYLGDQGITVSADIVREVAPAGSSPAASVESSTVAQIVEQMIRTSDDEAAESLLRHVGAATGGEASFADGSAAVKEILGAAGVNVEGLVLNDGSGLAYPNRISPTTLVEVVRSALGSGRFAPLVDDMPVSGFSGTLTKRFDADVHGLVRGKTGTLTGVHSLAGIALDAQGTPVVYAIMADQANEAQAFGAQIALDRVAASIATCECSS